jgi:predicted transcriptional regulator
VRQAVSGRKTLAYTTVMTLLERLARKGLASRCKVGRAFLYAPQTPRDTLRRIALREFLEAYFDGSEQQLREFLQGERRVPAESSAPEFEPEPRLDTALL